MYITWCIIVFGLGFRVYMTCCIIVFGLGLRVYMGSSLHEGPLVGPQQEYGTNIKGTLI